MFKKVREWYENKTFAKKILYSTVIFCIIPFLISTLITSIFFVNILIERTTKSIEDANNKIALLIGKRFSQCEYSVDSLICDPTFLCLLRNEDVFLTAYEADLFLKECISELQTAIPEIEEIIIYGDAELSEEMFRPLSGAAQNKNINYAVSRQYTTWYTEEVTFFISF